MKLATQLYMNTKKIWIGMVIKIGEKKKEKVKKVLDFFKNSYITIAVVLTVLQILAIIQPLSILYALLIFCSNMLLFLFTKDFLSGNQKKIGFKMFKASFILFIYDLFGLLGKTLNNYSTNGKSLKPLIFLLGIGTTIGIITYFSKKENRKIFDNVYENSILEKLKLIDVNEKIGIGDAVLCINQDSKKPVVIPYEDRFLHMLVLGPTGCGKTSQVIIPLINQDMKQRDYGITVIEPKGDLAEKVYAMAKHYGRDDAVYFNPMHPDCPYFNPLYGQEDEVIENMATTFKMLNPDSPQFFQDMNETLIRNALKVLKRLKGNSATLIDLSTLIYNSQGQGKIMINQFARLKTDTVEIAKENGEIASWFLAEYFNDRSKTYEHCSGIRSQVAKITSNAHLRRVLNPPNGENDVNFEKIIEEGKVLAICTAQGDLRDLGSFLGYFIILNLQSAVFKRPGNEDTRRAHFLYIDEFQVYSNPGFADMLTQGRSYRVASHLATQNRALMAMGGGRDGKNFVELVSTNARNIVIFPGGNSNDAKFYSTEFGEVTETEYRKSISRAKFNPLFGIQKIKYPNESISESEVTKPRYSTSDIIFRKFGEVTYRIISNKTVQTPGIGIVSWIPKELNSEINKIVDKYNEMQEQKLLALKEINNPEDEEDKPLIDAISVDEAPNRNKTDTKDAINDINDFDFEDSDDDVVIIKKEPNNKEVAPNKQNREVINREDVIIDINDESLDDLI